MDIINLYGCSTETGIKLGLLHGCEPNYEAFNFVAIVPRGFEIPIAQCDTWEHVIGYLQEASLSDTSMRLLPIPIEGITDNTPDATEKTSGFGNVLGYVTKPSKFTFELGNFGVNYTKELMKMNNGLFACYLFTPEMMVGIKTSTGFSPANATIYKPKVKLENDKETSNLMVGFTDAKFLGETADAIQLPDNYDMPMNLSGLTGVEITEESTTSGVATVSIRYTGNESTDFGAVYATELADAGSWLAVNSAGATVAATAVAYNATAKTFAVSLVAGTYTLRLATPSNLVTAGIGTKRGGFVSNSISVTIP